MKFKKLDLLTLLIGLFIFASCKDTTNIGLDLDPNTAIEGKLVDSLTINSSTLLESPPQSVSFLRHPLGYLNDPLFGKTDASIAISVSLPSDAYDFGTNAVLDSAVLVLNYGGQFYGDSLLSVYSVDVKHLANDIRPYDSYPSNRIYATEPGILGNYKDAIYPNTPFKVTSIVTGAPDTLIAVKPQMRIKLNNTFFQNNIVNLSAAALKNNVTFSNAFKGLKLDLNKAQSTGGLGMMFFNLSESGGSYLELYFKRQNASNTSAIDTVLAKFPLDRSLNPVAATISHDYTGTPVKTQTDNPATQYNVTYISGLVGTRNKISFPHLKKFSAAVGNVIVNKAELVVDVSTGTDVSPFVAAPRIGLYRLDIANQRVNISDRSFFQTQYNSVDFGDAVFGGYLDPAKKRYIFIVTDYIQKLLNGKLEDYGTFLTVSPTTEFDHTAPTGASASRVVIGSGAKDASGNLINTNNRIKLNIYYTKIN